MINQNIKTTQITKCYKESGKSSQVLYMLNV